MNVNFQMFLINTPISPVGGLEVNFFALCLSTHGTRELLH